MYYPSSRKIVSSRAALPCRTETHFQSLPNMVLTSNTGECHHKTDNEGSLPGTWIIDEMRLAVQKVYRIV